MTVIDHSIAYNGQNMIKLGIYVESTNSMSYEQFRLKPSVILEIRRDYTCYAMNISRAKTTTPKILL